MEPSDPAAEGARLLQAGDLDGALQHLERAVAANPDDGRAHGLLGICRARKGDLQGGISALQEAARLQSESPGAHYNLAFALIQAQRSEEAVASLERTLALQPEHPHARAALDRIRRPSAPAPAPAAAPAPPASPSSSMGPIGTTPSVPSLSIAAPAVATPPWQSPPASQPAPARGPISFESIEPTGKQRIREPNTKDRIRQGLIWGPVFCQIWTLWLMVWTLLITSRIAEREKVELDVGSAVGFMAAVGLVGFTVVGLILGLIIGALDLDDGWAAGLTVVVAVCIWGLNVYLTGGYLYGIVIWVASARFIGRLISDKCQEMVEG